MTPKPKLLLQQTRNNLVELEFYGFIVHCDKNKKIKTCGKTQNYPYFHRSSAKPLQASIIKNYNTQAFYNLSDKEISVCCASHTGEPIHIEILKNLLNKAGLTEKDLLCPTIAPLNNDEQRKFDVYSPLHNNCSGKHTLMLLICKQMGWDTTTYLDKNHPLQIAIKKQIQELCERKDDMPFTLDGCMAPNWATSLEELTKGFYNLFCTEEYTSIKNAFLNNPYLIGGNERPDTNMMYLNHSLVAKAGAGGLLCIANTQTKEVLTVKVIDANMKARSIIAFNAIQQLGWINTKNIDKNLINKVCDTNVKTETGEVVGEFTCCFESFAQS